MTAAWTLSQSHQQSAMDSSSMIPATFIGIQFVCIVLVLFNTAHTSRNGYFLIRELQEADCKYSSLVTDIKAIIT